MKEEFKKQQYEDFSFENDHSRVDTYARGSESLSPTKLRNSSVSRREISQNSYSNNDEKQIGWFTKHFCCKSNNI